MTHYCIGAVWNSGTYATVRSGTVVPTRSGRLSAVAIFYQGPVPDATKVTAPTCLGSETHLHFWLLALLTVSLLTVRGVR